MRAQAKAKKYWGQHFLKDTQVLQDIVQVIAPQKKDLMVEIGPGFGALTTALLPYLEALHVVEIDPEAIAYLQQLGFSAATLCIHAHDVLTFDFSKLTGEARTLRVVGNLPYNISTPILFHLLASAPLIQDIFVMLQKEVVDRICALPNTKAYGRLSVALQYYFSVNHVFDVPPAAFKPPPKVNSAVLRLCPYDAKPAQAENEQHFLALVKQAFSHRRKTLKNNLRGIVESADMITLGIDPGLRAQALSVSDFVNLANFYTKQALAQS